MAEETKVDTLESLGFANLDELDAAIAKVEADIAKTKEAGKSTKAKETKLAKYNAVKADVIAAKEAEEAAAKAEEEKQKKDKKLLDILSIGVVLAVGLGYIIFLICYLS